MTETSLIPRRLGQQLGLSPSRRQCSLSTGLSEQDVGVQLLGTVRGEAKTEDDTRDIGVERWRTSVLN